MMRIIIAGASGMIGSAVTAYLNEQGNEIVRLVRREPDASEVRWDPKLSAIDAEGLEHAADVW